jgi:hypothetical protein
MGVGSWSLPLSPNIPRKVLDSLNVEKVGFGHIVVTKTHIDPLNYSDATILGMSKYTGVYRAQPDEFTMTGVSLAAWLSDEDNKGNLIETALTATQNLAAWITALRPPALTAGTVTSPAGTVSQTFYLSSPADAINVVTSALGCEWRINPNFTLDAGLASVMYPATPKAVIIRAAGESGRDLNVTGVQGGVELNRDLEDYSTKIIVSSTGATGATAVATATAGSVPYFDGLGNTVTIKRTVDIGQVDPASAPGFATTELGLFNTVHREMTLDATTYDISADIHVGDPLWVYDALLGLIDQTQQQYYRGKVITPMVTRCVGYTWPIQNGMGVYFRYFAGGVATYIDLTNYIAWETAGTQIEIGVNPRPSTGSGSLTIANAAKARVPSWTPQINTGITLGNGTITGEYWVADGTCTATIQVTFGTTTALTGDVSFVQPIPATNTLTLNSGKGRATLGAVPADLISLVTASGGIFARGITATGTPAVQTPLSATFPFTWASGAVLLITATYPI